jgi:hypothetical protein
MSTAENLYPVARMVCINLTSNAPGVHVLMQKPRYIYAVPHTRTLLEHMYVIVPCYRMRSAAAQGTPPQT